MQNNCCFKSEFEITSLKIIILSNFKLKNGLCDLFFVRLSKLDL